MARTLIMVNAVLIAVFLLLAGFFSVYADHGPRSVYDERMAQLGTGGQGQMAAIYAYLVHRTDDLSFLTVPERTHMGDVRRVIDAFTAAFVVVLAVLLIELLIMARTPIITRITKSKRGTNKKEGERTHHDDRFDPITKGFLYGGVLALVLAVLLAASTLAGFDSFWTAFHHVLFPQGDWMFPADSVLITLFPEAFFEGFATQVLLAIAAFSLLAIGASRLRPR